MDRLNHAPYRAMLRSINKPARYLGGELNAIDKSPEFFELDRKDRVHFGLCFPDLYEIGMSNLAIQVLYSILNRDERVFCERFFAPDLDMRQIMIEEGLPLLSLESGTPLSDFDLVGFSLHYELSYTAILEMLERGGVPIRSEDRGEDDPIVIAGGPIACNLEPVAPFLDAIFLGDSEEALEEITGVFRRIWSQGGGREDMLLGLSAIEGIYIPSFYQAAYLPDGRFEKILPLRPGIPARIEKRLIRDLNLAPMPNQPVVPNIEVVHDRMVMEVLRGCARGCRFCQAGFTYRPLRERTAKTLTGAARELIANTGYEEMGLLSLTTGDHSELEDLVRALLPMTEPRHINLSLPSLRLDSFDPDLAREIAKTRRAGLTFAPEAGTQRLRDVINKNITEEDMLGAAESAFKNGWDRLKLYFMLGLPTETEEDLAGIVLLVKNLLNLWESLPREERSRRINITVSTSFFIPKPFTPFQWAPQVSFLEMRQKQQYLAAALKDRRVSFQWHDFESSVIEAVLSRGDRRLAPVIEEAWRQGAYLDAWHEHFQHPVWFSALENIGTDLYTRERDLDEAFPWDHLDLGVTRRFLAKEWLESKAGRTTPSCYDGCSACGSQRYRTGVCPGGYMA